jgi:transposase
MATQPPEREQLGSPVAIKQKGEHLTPELKLFLAMLFEYHQFPLGELAGYANCHTSRISRYAKCLREMKPIHRRTIRRGTYGDTDAVCDYLKVILERDPAMTLAEMALRVREENPELEPTANTIAYCLRYRMQYTRKKLDRRMKFISLSRIGQFRRQFCFKMNRYALRDVIFVDEVSKDNMALLHTHGYAPRGSVVNRVLENTRSQRYSFLVGINTERVELCSYTDGTFNSEKFLKIMERHFALQKRRRLYIIDGARIHKPLFLKALCASRHDILVLPPYCPFLNPIELLFAQYKAYLRGREADKVLNASIEFFRGPIAKRHLASYVGHCGYTEEPPFLVVNQGEIENARANAIRVPPVLTEDEAVEVYNREIRGETVPALVD